MARAAHLETHARYVGRTNLDPPHPFSSVLGNGVTEVAINIRTNRTYAIDGALGVKLKKIGFDLGGLMQHSGATSLYIRASFPHGRKGWR
jgi:hypothetical protein